MTYPSPLTHSWPLFDQHEQFDLGCLLDVRDDASADPRRDAAGPTVQAAGR